MRHTKLTYYKNCHFSTVQKRNSHFQLCN